VEQGGAGRVGALGTRPGVRAGTRPLTNR